MNRFMGEFKVAYAQTRLHSFSFYIQKILVFINTVKLITRTILDGAPLYP